MTVTASRERPVRRVRYRRPAMYPKQEAAIFAPKRYAVIEASTKSGKTVGCIIWIHEMAALFGRRGRHFWWVAPTAGVAKIAFRRLKFFLPLGSYESNETERTVTLRNGATIWFKSAERADLLYGEDVYAAVIDEATRVSEEAWIAVRSTLTATRGPCRIIGNVKGKRNWCYRLARRAEAGKSSNMHYAKLTVWDAVAAGIFPEAEALDAKDLLDEATFAELYLAEAGDTEILYFDVSKFRVASSWPAGTRKVCRAWDFAASEPKPGRDPDYTVGAKLAIAGDDVYVVDLVRGQWSPDESVQKVKEVAASDGRKCKQIIEEEYGAAGKILVAQFADMLRAVDGAGKVEGAKPSGGKTVRAYHFAAKVNAGRVHLVAPPGWHSAFIAEADDFPDVEHDDQIDAAAHAFNYLAPASAAPRVRFLS